LSGARRLQGRKLSTMALLERRNWTSVDVGVKQEEGEEEEEKADKEEDDAKEK